MAPDVRKFRDEGYLVHHEQVFAPSRFAALRDYFEELLDSRPDGQRPESMDVPHFTFPKLFEWLFDKSVLDLAEQFVGPDIALWSSHFICKPAGDGQAVPWHEDSAYWKGRLDPQEVVTIWLAIDDSDVGNGCMRVLPGTHKLPDSAYEPVADPAGNLFGTRIRDEFIDESRAVDLEIKAGECHMHHARMMHSSAPNTSARRRCGYTMRFMSSAVRHTGNGGHKIYLARGRDLANNAYADPGA